MPSPVPATGDEEDDDDGTGIGEQRRRLARLLPPPWRTVPLDPAPSSLLAAMAALGAAAWPDDVLRTALASLATPAAADYPPGLLAAHLRRSLADPLLTAEVAATRRTPHADASAGAGARDWLGPAVLALHRGDCRSPMRKLLGELARDHGVTAHPAPAGGIVLDAHALDWRAVWVPDELPCVHLEPAAATGLAPNPAAALELDDAADGTVRSGDNFAAFAALTRDTLAAAALAAPTEGAA